MSMISVRIKMKNKIGVGVVTYKRPDYFKTCINSIPNVDTLVVVNDGDPYDASLYPSNVKEVIQHTKNKSVGVSKNELMKYLIDDGCEHIFLVEDDMDMDIEETQLPGDEFGMEESFDFSEQELEEMLNMAEGDGLDEYGDEHHISTEDAVAQSSAQAPNLTPQHSGEGEGEDIMAEADKTSDPFTVDAPKQFNLKESTEALRMKKLAGLL